MDAAKQAEVDRHALKVLRLCKWAVNFHEDLQSAVKNDADYHDYTSFPEKFSDDRGQRIARLNCHAEIVKAFAQLEVGMRRMVADVVHSLLREYLDSSTSSHVYSLAAKSRSGKIGSMQYSTLTPNGKTILYILERARLGQEVKLPD